MESQLSGQKVSLMSYTCHNSGGQATRRGVRSRKNSTYKRDLQVQKKDFLTFGPLSRSTDQLPTLEHRIERLQHLCGNGTDLVAIREATKAVEEVKQAFLESRRARQEELPEGDREKALAEYDHLMDLSKRPAAELQHEPATQRQGECVPLSAIVRISKLPTFSLGILEFKAFWRQFEGAVHRRKDFGDVTKFILPIWRSPPTCQWSDNRDKNYEAVVRLLHDRFHRTTDILDAHISRLHEIRPRFGTTRSRFSLIEVALLLPYKYNSARRLAQKGKLYYDLPRMISKLKSIKSHCVIFETEWTNPNCVDPLQEPHRMACVECDPRAQLNHKKGKCTGQGVLKQSTPWNLLYTKHCFGRWSKTQSTSNCRCDVDHPDLPRYIFV
ncbi:hypothetical protein T01_3384 [Trichinella spiralis]|uniref:SBSPON-like C-terminal domain-containing protein n=1 Tax=Trichinella spiralis TaxID=6334 RepID=A0A0V1C1S3_TRISP|nr:hypothetical protein T01_3384 [Trichinella spiralis]